MSYAIVIAALALIASAAGLLLAFRLYCAGELRRRYLLAASLGFASLLAFLLVLALTPLQAGGPATLAILVPGVAALPVLLRERGR